MPPENLVQALMLDEADAELEAALLEWRDAGASVSTVVAAISELIDARIAFALNSSCR
jgi:hypothetical protein